MHQCPFPPMKVPIDGCHGEHLRIPRTLFSCPHQDLKIAILAADEQVFHPTHPFSLTSTLQDDSFSGIRARSITPFSSLSRSPVYWASATGVTRGTPDLPTTSTSQNEISKSPSDAHSSQTRSSKGQPLSRIHFNISKWPSLLAAAAVSSHSHPISLNHFNIARSPQVAAKVVLSGEKDTLFRLQIALRRQLDSLPLLRIPD